MNCSAKQKSWTFSYLKAAFSCHPLILLALDLKTFSRQLILHSGNGQSLVWDLNATGSHLDIMQAFTPFSPVSAQAGTREGEQAGLEFWDGNQKLEEWCQSEGTGGRRWWEKASFRVHTVAWFDGRRRGGSEVMGEGSRERRRGILPVTWAMGSRQSTAETAQRYGQTGNP